MVYNPACWFDERGSRNCGRAAPPAEHIGNSRQSPPSRELGERGSHMGRMNTWGLPRQQRWAPLRYPEPTTAPTHRRRLPGQRTDPGRFPRRGSRGCSAGWSGGRSCPREKSSVSPDVGWGDPNRLNRSATGGTGFVPLGLLDPNSRPGRRTGNLGHGEAGPRRAEDETPSEECHASYVSTLHVHDRIGNVEEGQSSLEAARTRINRCRKTIQPHRDPNAAPHVAATLPK